VLLSVTLGHAKESIDALEARITALEA
jgi:hypothetical protein